MTGLDPRPARPLLFDSLAPAEELVVTVGGSPVPVLLTLLARQPRRVVAIVSDRSAPVWHRVWAAYQASAPDPRAESPRVIEVPAWGGAELTDALSASMRQGSAWELGYSGGSPAMGAEAFAAWWHATAAQRERIAGLRAWYAAEHGDVVVGHDGGYLEAGEVLGGRNLPLADVLTLHGLTPLGRVAHPERWRPHRCGAAPHSVSSRLLGLPTEAPAARREVLNHEAEAHVLDALALIAATGGADVYPRTQVETIDPDGAPQTLDLTLAAVHGLGLRLGEVVSFRPLHRGQGHAGPGRTVSRFVGAGELKEALFDIEQRARRAGGMHAGAALISLEPIVANEQPAVVTIWNDFGPNPTPTRLPAPGEESALPLPTVTAFTTDELLRALDDVAAGQRAADGGDLARWLCGVTT